ncbi:phospholipase D-like domain-containing protein [Luteolibacter sp. LG18]|uniref:phospholipase D-like domain-containing protein n=1 Tax=Luteolibacter sp. LG18 TaxID=2819286 RepID=UPI0030C6B9DD
MKTGFQSSLTKDGFTLKLWRGEGVCMLAMSVEEPEDDFVGFAIERKPPGSKHWTILKNRIAFDYPKDDKQPVDGFRNYSTFEAPIQKFRWMDFPHLVKPGDYTYRVTKMHMPADGQLVNGTLIELAIELDPVTHAGFLDIGFTRNFASSQAFIEKMGNPEDIDQVGKQVIPGDAKDGLDFEKLANPKGLYSWMAFQAYDLLFGFLDEAVKDEDVTVDMLAYDFNEPDMLAKLKQLGGRLRAVIDDSTEDTDSGEDSGHGSKGSAESRAARELEETAGDGKVKRTHFTNLQHHKVLIQRRGGVPCKVLCGSTNFSFRGLYIQSNNVLVFDDPDIAGLYGRMFDSVFEDPSGFKKTDLAKQWHLVAKEGKPVVRICFSPHAHHELSLEPVKGAIEGATSSVFYAVAFLSLIRKGGLTRDAFDRLMDRPVFSYGIADKGAKTGKGKGTLEIHKPDGSVGFVDFKYLAKNAPEPFRREWSGGKGINVHHKFVVTDFTLPTAKVITGSSNLAPSGEKNNGDHLIVIEDQRVATAYVIEALRVFDHLHFRSVMQEAEENAPKGEKKSAARNRVLKLQKPKAISGKSANWFESHYQPDSQKEKDRRLFSGT